MATFREQYGRSSVIAVALACADALLFNQGFVSLMILLVVSFVFVPRALWVFARDKELFALRLVRATIYAIAALCALLFVRWNNDIARKRADQLIVACQQYRASHQQYPARLEELIPEFLPRVPSPRLVSFSTPNLFQYLASTNKHELIYVGIPPYGRMHYVLEEGRWNFRD